MLFLDAFFSPLSFLSKPVAQYWNCTFLEPIWKSHAEILSCSPLLLCLYCPELEIDLHKWISLKEKQGLLLVPFARFIQVNVSDGQHVDIALV